MKNYTKLFTVFIIFLSATAWADESLCIISNDAIKQASEIRGLKIKKQTPCFLHNKAEVQAYLLEAISSKVPPARMKAESQVYKALGLIAENFDYEKGLLKLYLDQLGGYYDPEKDHFVMAAWIPAIMQVPVAVHELTHALQDQHYDLNEFTNIKKYSSDELLARSALIEGDATAVMLDYTRKLAGLEPISKDKDVTAIMMQNLLGASMFAGLKEVPESLKLTLLFPYTSGLRFVHELLKNTLENEKEYIRVDRAFMKPPRSTEEILHPEKYFAEKSDFTKVSISKSVLTESDLVYEDTLGEFSISGIFSMYLPDKARIAKLSAGWGGDRVGVYETITGSTEVVWNTAWDSEVDSKDFFEGYKEVITNRSKNLDFDKPDKVIAVTKFGAGIEMTRLLKNVEIRWKNSKE